MPNVGQRRVKPSESFKPSAKPISKTPATNTWTQVIFDHSLPSVLTTVDSSPRLRPKPCARRSACDRPVGILSDRKSTRLNSSHANISYAVFCLKKKNIETSGSPLRELD